MPSLSSSMKLTDGLNDRNDFLDEIYQRPMKTFISNPSESLFTDGIIVEKSGY